MSSTTERLNMTITTTAGNVQAQIEVPTGFIPITKIVPVMQSLGDQAQELEIARTKQSGRTISCQKGCAACCRPMIPVSPPEAFSLVEVIKDLPQDHQNRIKHNLATIKTQLQAAGLLNSLQNLAHSPRQPSDEELDSLNRAYYALRLPCIFLENEVCSIYERRPAGCRGHLVTSPPELCQDMEHNPIEELNIPLRAGTVLSLLWADLTNDAVRLIPLPVAIEWAKTHQNLNTQTWKGMDIMNRAMKALGKFLHQTLTSLSLKSQEPKR